jgi:hypothetical protein
MPPKKWSDGATPPPDAGVYAMFLANINDMPESWKTILGRDDGLFYIGKGSTGLRKRLKRHFLGAHSTKDTFRRSVGAILREYLQLMLILRSSASNCSQYSFKNEEVLSAWIQENCHFTYLVIPKHETGSREIDIIHELLPPLNIQNNPGKIKEVVLVREECRRLVCR